MSSHQPARLRGTVISFALLASAALPGCSSVSDPDDAVAAFLAAAGAPDRSVHVVTSAEAMLPLVGEAAFESEFDLVGDEYYGNSTMRALGEVVDVRLASIAGQSYSAFFGAETMSAESRPVMRPDPLAGLTGDDLVVVGTDRKADRDVVHLRVDSSSAAEGAIGTFGHLGLGDVSVDASTFDLYVTVDGAPVLAEIEVTASATGELSGTIEAGIGIRFSRWSEIEELPTPFEITRFPDGTTFVADNRFDEALIWRDLDGRELRVEACSRGTSTEFDGTAFSVEFAADGHGLLSTEPGREVYRYVLVAPGSTTIGEVLPVISQKPSPPCAGRNG